MKRKQKPPKRYFKVWTPSTNDTNSIAIKLTIWLKWPKSPTKSTKTEWKICSNKNVFLLLNLRKSNYFQKTKQLRHLRQHPKHDQKNRWLRKRKTQTYWWISPTLEVHWKADQNLTVNQNWSRSIYWMGRNRNWQKSQKELQ